MTEREMDPGRKTESDLKDTDVASCPRRLVSQLGITAGECARRVNPAAALAAADELACSLAAICAFNDPLKYDLYISPDGQEGRG